MSRNYVICCDGTNNQFGIENTSVVRLIQVLLRDPSRQRLYYDPGVGTLPEPGALTAVRKTLSKWYGLAFGAGLTWKVQQAYSYLMDFWEPGDRVFLFGFSRGAYTARVLAGMLHTLGLLPRGNDNLVPYVMRLYKSIRGMKKPEDGGSTSAYWKLCDDFRWTFARPISADVDERRFRVHFVGLWDTVSSVGWIWNPPSFPYTTHNDSVDVIRHAVAVDERRWFFRQNLMHRTPNQNLEERWFPGVHSDVGGGYPESEGGLWRPSFEWMLEEAEKAGMLVDQDRLRVVRNITKPPADPWNERIHESLTRAWWPAEFFPKLVWDARLGRRKIGFGFGRHRYIPDGAMIHSATLRRIREKSGYVPPNMTSYFLDAVRNLPSVPESIPYMSGSGGS